MTRHVLLTGASSGIGQAAALLLADRGYEVWATARDAARLPKHAHIHPLALDLADPVTIDRAWSRALAEAGHLDVLVQNAGAGIFGAVEDVTMDDAARQWQVLVHGPLQLMRHASAHFRQRRAGVIVGVTSLAGEMPLPFGAHYSAGKAALSALLAGLQMELRPFGVRVIDLRPGDIRTNFNQATEAAQLPYLASIPYSPWINKAWKVTKELMAGAPEPELAARAILKAIGRPREVVRCGTFFQARLGALGVRVLPRRLLLDSIRGYYQLHRVDREVGP